MGRKKTRKEKLHLTRMSVLTELQCRVIELAHDIEKEEERKARWLMMTRIDALHKMCAEDYESWCVRQRVSLKRESPGQTRLSELIDEKQEET